MSLGRGWRPALLGAVVWALASQLAAGFAAPTMRAQAARTVAGAHKILHVVRHGQAQHNVRAEPARANGCSYEEFLELMRLDDAFDATLTPAGVDQARQLHQSLPPSLHQSVQLVVASSLTRAIQTADIVFPQQLSRCRRISLDLWREVSGLLVNAKRQTREQLRAAHAEWDFDQLEANEDELWTEDKLEDAAACAHRAYLALDWAWQRPEETICIVAHGGILSYALSEPGHPSLQVLPGANKRFHNCEMRSYVLRRVSGAAAAHHGDQGVKGAGGNGGGGGGERVGDNTDAQTEGECTAVYSLEPLTHVGPTVSAAPGSGAAEA